MALVLNGTTGLQYPAGGSVNLYEDSANGTNFIGLKAPANVTTNATFVLPSADGTVGQALVTDGSKNLSFASLQPYDANTAKYNATTSNFTGTLQNNGNNVLTVANIGTSVQAYDVDIPTVSASQAEMEAGTETAVRSMSPLRIKQAITALVPPGGGTVQAIASGTLPNGAPIVLKSDGKVEAVSQNTPTSVGPVSNAALQYPCSIYDSTNNKLIVFYIRNNGTINAGYVAVGTVSGNSISFGTPVAVDTVAVTGEGRIAHDSANNKIVVTYATGAYPTATIYTKIGTISGTSITFGTAVSTFSVGYPSVQFDIAYYPPTQKIIVIYQDVGNTNTGYGRVGTISGTSITFGTNNQFYGGQFSSGRLVYDPSSTQMLATWYYSNNGYIGIIPITTTLGTISSTGGISYSSSGSPNIIDAKYISTLQKIAVYYSEPSSSTTSLRLVSVSGSTITVNDPTVITGTSINVGCNFYKIEWHTSSQRLVLIGGKIISGNAIPIHMACSISGNSFVIEDVIYLPSNGYSAGGSNVGIIYMTTEGKCVITYRDDYSSGSNVALQNVISNPYATNLNSKNFIGFSKGSYTDGQTATVHAVSSVNTAQTGLTTALKYYVSTSGTLSPTALNENYQYAGVATSSTSILVKG